MAKITMADGSTFEGSIAEWVELSNVAVAEPQQPKDARPITSYDDLAVGMTLQCVANEAGSGVIGIEYKIAGKNEYGDYYVVTHGEREDYVTYNREVGTWAAEYVIVGDAPLKVGDYVKIVELGGQRGVAVGEILVLIKDDKSITPYQARNLAGDVERWFKASRLVKATDAEVAAAKAPKLSVGDKMRLKSTTGALVGFEVGQIVEVMSLKSGGTYPITVRGKIIGFTNADNLEPVTDAELSYYQASVAEAARWDEIGRKVNEYKAGDIVETISGGVYPNGTIGVITEVGHEDSFRVESSGKRSANWHGMNDVKLVTPVEARFDRK